tara:strand:+ start:121 stop:351 length:231 start_codon:yes stop_codon:yes gene_type:complete
VEVPVKKTWKKPKIPSLICGYCEVCNKQLMSDEGGWIITAEKKYFCHDGKDGSCFDSYCIKQLQLRSEDATYEKEK